MNHNSTKKLKTNLTSLFDKFDFLKEVRSTFAITATLGFIAVISYIEIALKCYEALAQIRMIENYLNKSRESI